MKAGCRGVVDGNLEAVEADVLTWARCQRIGPDKDATVAALADLEVKRQDKVSPHLLVDHHVATGLVRVDGPVFNRHIAWLTIAGLPSIQGLAVEQQEPASLLFLR